jgi:hypothetical protein
MKGLSPNKKVIDAEKAYYDGLISKEELKQAKTDYFSLWLYMNPTFDIGKNREILLKLYLNEKIELIGKELL